MLDIERGDVDAIGLSWPTSADGGVWIEQTNDLASPFSWFPMTDLPQVDDSKFALQISIDAPSTYFRSAAANSIIFVSAEDENSGSGTLANPFQSIALALKRARTQFAATNHLQTIYVFTGEYREPIQLVGTDTPGLGIRILDSSVPVTYRRRGSVPVTYRRRGRRR